MATSSKKHGSYWKADWFVGVLVVLAVLSLHFFSDFFRTIEYRYYDFASTSTARQPSDKIAIIAIDDQSIANIGRWPWPRDVHAKLIDQLAAANAKTIAYTAFFFEPQTDRGLTYIKKMKDALAASQAGVAPPVADPAAPPAKPATGAALALKEQLDAGSAATLAMQQQFSKIIGEAEVALDTDTLLANSMKKAGNVIVPSVFALGAPQGNPDHPLPAFALKSTVDDPNGFAVPASTGQQPIDIIGSNAAGVAHLNQLPDETGAVRQEPLLVDYYGKAIPSLSLMIAVKNLNLNVSDIKLHPGESVQIGKLRVRTDDRAMMLPQFYRGHDGKPAFSVDSFYDVTSGKIPYSKYANKIVIIGATAAGVGTQFATPAGSGLSPAEIVAHVTSSIMNEHFIVQPSWGIWATMLAVLLVAAYLIAGLPRLSAGKAAIVTSGLFAVLLITEFTLLSASAIWLQFVFAAALLLIGHLALTTKRFLVTEAGKLKSDEESAETNRMMGLALQGQGQLDAAFDRFRRVPLSDALMDNLNNLALDFERKRQFNKAEAVYEFMATYNKGHKDLQAKLNRAKNLSETVMLGGGNAHAGGTLLLDGGGVEKPMLGRYQVEKELGKGAMGIVYLGKDPKIGRVVAIKTMALSQEFEGGELDDARERFFREAETAGRLQHQNIVTIFDAGEEHDLAYIAMEFIKGKDLADSSKDNLLPVPKVLSIVARVADALAYAHQQGVVHRDIKPANIMCDLEADTVKVTDFGIARITDSSKTKTGVILGTPSYMSPEQVAGERIDGRSDLFSLGVMLFQMLTGQLPFQADSLARLMYMIANEPAPDIRSIRPELPERLAKLVALSLNKKPETRYQEGGRFATHLRGVIAELSNAPIAASTGGNAVAVAGSVAATSELAKTMKVDRSEVAAEMPDIAKTMKMERPAAAEMQDIAKTMKIERSDIAEIPVLTAVHEKTIQIRASGDSGPSTDDTPTE